MKRLFWIAAGAAAGVLIARRLTRAANSFTPEGAADRVSGAVGNLSAAVRQFTEDVKAGMAERDAELRDSLGIADNGVDEVDLARLHELFEQHDHPRGT
jgi:outer membrane murein-binding lipoprotein Lpp